MSRKRMSKSQRFSRQAHEREKRRKRRRSREENEMMKKRKVRKKENRMRTEIIKIMNAGRNEGISYKKSKKNINDRTHQNNISAVNALFRELKIYRLQDIKKDKIMEYFEKQKREFDDGKITKGGFINNKVKGLQRFYDSSKVARGLSKRQRETLLENGKFINDLNDWKNESDIVKSKGSSRYLKPNSDELKSINDCFHYLRTSKSDDQALKLASDYHRFSLATGSRIEHATNATLNNIKKIDDGRYLYIVNEGEDKTDKARTKLIKNKNDIKFLDRFIAEVEARADRNNEAYLFEIKKNGDSISRSGIRTTIQDVYREHFKSLNKTVQRKVRGKDRLYNVDQSFVPHSSRSASIQRDLRARVSRYERSQRAFERDLAEMIEFDNSKGSFKRDQRGAVAYGYDQMKRDLGRELTFIERAMYLTSCAAGHNRIDVIRDHYFSDEIIDWLREKQLR